MVKKIIKIVGTIFAVLLLVVLIYVAYVFISYHRIEDNQKLSVNEPKSMATNGTVMSADSDSFTIGTYNVGFGAYTPDFSFFMDGGKYSRCYSKETSAENIKNAAKEAIKEEPDFMIFQEVDIDSTRSCHVNQNNLITDIFDSYYETFAVNYDSAYLFYPFNKPIGKSYSGISTYSKFKISDSIRRSFPISTSFSKILDLDRCYSINRIKVDNGKDLVIINAHLSAYGNSDEIREGQVNKLFEDMKKERDAGNYVICGGDFNHDLKLGESQTEECESWAYTFPRSKMPQGFRFAMDELSDKELENMPESNRNTDEPYNPDTTFVCTLDGFIISDNIQMLDYEIKDTGYAYSDHEPVFMQFKFK